MANTHMALTLTATTEPHIENMHVATLLLTEDEYLCEHAKLRAKKIRHHKTKFPGRGKIHFPLAVCRLRNTWICLLSTVDNLDQEKHPEEGEVQVFDGGSTLSPNGAIT